MNFKFAQTLLFSSDQKLKFSNFVFTITLGIKISGTLKSPTFEIGNQLWKGSCPVSGILRIPEKKL